MREREETKNKLIQTSTTILFASSSPQKRKLAPSLDSVQCPVWKCSGTRCTKLHNNTHNQIRCVFIFFLLLPALSRHRCIATMPEKKMQENLQHRNWLWSTMLPRLCSTPLPHPPHQRPRPIFYKKNATNKITLSNSTPSFIFLTVKSKSWFVRGGAFCSSSSPRSNGQWESD